MAKYTAYIRSGNTFTPAANVDVVTKLDCGYNKLTKYIERTNQIFSENILTYNKKNMLQFQI
jgi:hypothetical protein